MIYALVRADRDGARARFFFRNSHMREARCSCVVVTVLVVLGLGAAAPRRSQDPVVVLISTLEGRLEGVMVEERGEGVLVEAEAARHVTYVASWLPTAAA